MHQKKTYLASIGRLYGFGKLCFVFDKLLVILLWFAYMVNNYRISISGKWFPYVDD